MGYAKIVEIKEGKLLQFPVKKEEDVIVKLPKLTKAGDIKKTYSSSYKGQERKSYPFKNQKEMQNMISYFLDKKQYVYYLIFVIGINMGRRIGDTLNLKWENFYFKNGEMRSKILSILEEKTDKMANPVINKACIMAIEYYLNITGIDPSENMYKDYVFKGFKEGEHISDEAYRINLKKAAEACNIKQNISSHSTRKTFGYWTRQLHPHDQDSMTILRQIYNHGSEVTTETYIGLSDEKIEKYYDDMGNFFCDYVMNNKNENEYKIVSSEDMITIDKNTLTDIIKMIYQDGIKNANVTDYKIHLETIEASVDIIMDSIV